MRRFPTVIILALAALAGCGGSEEESYTLVKVSGTITRNSKPLAGAKVSFLPDGGNPISTPGSDQTGPEGNYLVAFKGRSGVAAGKYKVIITPALELPGGAKIPPEYENQPGMYRLMLQTQNKVDKPARAESKQVAAKSEFEAVVEPDISSKTLDFDVKSSS
jgi:hypothetical protein